MELITQIAGLLKGYPIPESWLIPFVRGILVLVLLIVAGVFYWLAKRIFLKQIKRFAEYTKYKVDNILFENRVFHRLADFLPVLIIYIFLPEILEDSPFKHVTEVLVSILLIINIALIINATLNALQGIYLSFQFARNISIRPFIQVLKIGLFFISGILVLSLLLDKSPLYFLSGLGALTAILLLIFKDVLLGFVAGIQLIANRMVAPGDWIEVPQYGADGDVIDITLTTVKVQNWDKTITTIPTYALISESFKNWRSMPQSGGRRIKRALLLDQNSIRFCDQTMLGRFSKMQLLKDYIEDRKKQIDEHNQNNQIDEKDRVSGRNMTNIGVFRVYVENYLKNHPMINQKMTFLVRQLPPSDKGLPIEIYVFCKDTDWGRYESIQADIFDHILAVVAEFELRLFQNPTGADFAANYVE